MNQNQLEEATKKAVEELGKFGKTVAELGKNLEKIYGGQPTVKQSSDTQPEPFINACCRIYDEGEANRLKDKAIKAGYGQWSDNCNDRDKYFHLCSDESFYFSQIDCYEDNILSLTELTDHLNKRIKQQSKVSIVPDGSEYNLATHYFRFKDLQKLMWLRDETWRRDNNWKPDWMDECQGKYSISANQKRIEIFEFSFIHRFLCFQTKDLAQQFLDTHKDLIEECKEFL